MHLQSGVLLTVVHLIFTMEFYIIYSFLNVMKFAVFKKLNKNAACLD